jgi:hypothetical protein
MMIGMKQGDRKLFVLNGKYFQTFYMNIISPNSFVFFDVKVLRVRKK